jgi:hypothetical protein
MVTLMLTDRTPFMTGSDFVIDGGESVDQSRDLLVT